MSARPQSIEHWPYEPDAEFAPDRARLLAPIPGASPAGESLRYEGTYDAIRSARQEEDTTLPQGVWQSDPRRADWRDVAERCHEALASRSKDLQLGVWLVEACLRLAGPRGLASGLDVLCDLCEVYWESMHPEMPADEPEFRSSPIAWMNEHFSVYLRVLPLTAPTGEAARRLNLADWIQARDRGPGNESTAKQEITTTTFLAAAEVVPSDFYRTLHADAGTALRSVTGFEALVDAHFDQRDAPTLAAIRDALNDIRRLAERVLGNRGEEAAMPESDIPRSPETLPEEDPATGAPSDGGDPAKAASDVAGPVQSREQAYQRLREAAHYLARTEPHSPVPYLVMRAVSWGDRSLGELLEELIMDERDLAFVLNLLGLDSSTRRRDPGSSGQES